MDNLEKEGSEVDKVEEKVESAKEVVKEKVEQAKEVAEEKVESAKEVVEEKVEHAKEVTEEKVEHAKEVVEEKVEEAKADCKSCSNDQVDVKAKFDEIISKKNLLDYIICGFSAVFSLNLLYMIIKLISFGSFNNSSSNGQNVVANLSKTMSKLESLKTVANLRDFAHVLIFLSLILLAVIYYKTTILDKRNDFLNTKKNLYFICGLLVTEIGNFVLKGAFSKASTFMLYLTVLVYLGAVAVFGYTAYTLYLELFKNKK
ncbi:hypothetical protein [Parvimonas sp. G1604]|uniref:hypothetical protein n=2 Tax=Parvimonas sp. G1604 TaxID=3388845 RepID=UPI00397E9AC0